MNPEDLKEKHALKQAKAESNRKKLKAEKKQKLKEASNKIKEANNRQDERITQQQWSVEQKLDRADQIHEAHIQEITRRASTENTKVGEIVFIQTQM